MKNPTFKDNIVSKKIIIHKHTGIQGLTNKTCMQKIRTNMYDYKMHVQ